MECVYCGTEMIPDGNGLSCPNCGDWVSALEIKFGKEPPIKDYQEKRFDWH